MDPRDEPKDDNYRLVARRERSARSDALEDYEICGEGDGGGERQTERQSGFAVANDKDDRGQYQHHPDRDDDRRHAIDGDVGDGIAPPRLMKDRDIK